MARILKPLVRLGIDYARRSKFIQQVFESPVEISKMKRQGTFTDSRGYQHILYEGLLNKVKPLRQRQHYSTRSVSDFDKDARYLRQQSMSGRISAEKVIPVIKALKGDLQKLNVLEIGCHSGATSYALADAGLGQVTGSDSSLHKLNATQRADLGSLNNSISQVNKALTELRELMGEYFHNKDRVSFVDDDISVSSLPDQSFDVICSWDVLEHVHDPVLAFKQMHRILKPGGIAIHDYNPFFCLNGGHSFCTTDFLWGHVRLTMADFDRYAEEWRSEIKDISKSFFRHGLNRMSASDFRTGTIEAGLEILAMMPFTREQHLLMIDLNILNQAMEVHPNITLSDLVTPRYISIQQKPI